MTLEGISVWLFVALRCLHAAGTWLNFRSLRPSQMNQKLWVILRRGSGDFKVFWSLRVPALEREWYFFYQFYGSNLNENTVPPSSLSYWQELKRVTEECELSWRLSPTQALNLLSLDNSLTTLSSNVPLWKHKRTAGGPPGCHVSLSLILYKRIR